MKNAFGHRYERYLNNARVSKTRGFFYSTASALPISVQLSLYTTRRRPLQILQPCGSSPVQEGLQTTVL